MKKLIALLLVLSCVLGLSACKKDNQTKRETVSDSAVATFELELDKHDRMITNDYIACMNSSMCRANDISYFAGVRDTLSFLIQAGLLKQSEK